MAKIVRVEIGMADLKPKVRRSDAIQSFTSQETPILRVFDSEGAAGDRNRLDCGKIEKERVMPTVVIE